MVMPNDKDDPGDVKLNNHSSLLVNSLKHHFDYEELVTTKYKFPAFQIYLKSYKDFTAITLPKEIEEGKFEYKVQLLDIKCERLIHLETQLKWRLEEGNNEAYYEIGVRDDGKLDGLFPNSLYESIDLLMKMCVTIGAHIVKIRLLCINPNEKLKKYVSEAHIRYPERYLKKQNIRVFMLGAGSVGKTTLMAVLTKDCNDDGCGSARLRLFNHLHEIKSGQTSSIAYSMIGFDKNGRVIKTGFNDDALASACKTVTLIDSCGNPKYFDTTMHGLTCHHPHFVLFFIGLHIGIDEKVREFLKILLNLGIPFIIILSHLDKVEEKNVLKVLKEISVIVGEITEKAVELIYDISQFEHEMSTVNMNKLIPAIPFSSITRSNIDLVYKILFYAQPVHIVNPVDRPFDKYILFQINSVYHVPDIGTVVSGILLSGSLKETDQLYIGPKRKDKSFELVAISSIKLFDIALHSLLPGMLASIALASHHNLKPHIKKGCFLINSDSPIFFFNISANITYKTPTIDCFIGLNGLLFVGNFQTSAVVNQVDICKTYSNTTSIEVTFSLTNNSYYIPPGLKLIFYCKSHTLVGYVIKTF